MQKIALITDTTADLTPREVQETKVFTVPIQLIYDNSKSYRDVFEINYEDVLRDIDVHNIKSSSPINNDIINVYNEVKKQGYTHAIIIPISSGISGTYSAMSQLASQYLNDITYEVLDAKTVSRGMAYLILRASKMIESGFEFNKIVEDLNYHAQNHSILFAVNNLKYLQKGGRISKKAQVMGDLLGIVPLIKVTKEGTLESFSKTRGEKKALRSLIDEALKEVPNPKSAIIVHSDNLKSAQLLRDFIKGRTNLDAQIYHLGSVLCAHTGKGLVGFGFFN